MAGRRDNGAGYIYQRKDGKGWRGRLQDGRKPDGSVRYVNFSGKTEAEVKRKIREYHKSEDKDFQQKTITVGEYLINWLHTYKRGTIKDSSYDRLENTAKHQVIPSIGDIQLQALTSDDIQNMIMDLKRAGKSYSTVKKAYDCLNAALRHATIADDIRKNPMLMVNMPEGKLFEQTEIRYFTKDECRRIVEECGRKYSTGAPVYHYGDVFILILNTGLRIGEAIGLLKTDWNQEEKTLHIRRTIARIKERDEDGKPTGSYKRVSNTTKTYSGDRILPLNANATGALQRLCDQAPESLTVVSNSVGKPASPERVERSFYSVLNNIGLEKTGVHSLRHTFASFLFAAGTDVKTVSKMLGHANIQITLNTYIHLIEKTDQQAVIKLDDIY